MNALSSFHFSEENRKKIRGEAIALSGNFKGLDLDGGLKVKQHLKLTPPQTEEPQGPKP